MSEASSFSKAEEIVKEICERDLSYAEVQQHLGRSFDDGWFVFLVACRQVDSKLYGSMIGGTAQDKNRDSLIPYRKRVEAKIEEIHKLCMHGWRVSSEDGANQMEKTFTDTAAKDLAAELIAALYTDKVYGGNRRFPPPILYFRESDKSNTLYMSKAHFDKICRLEGIENGLAS